MLKRSPFCKKKCLFSEIHLLFVVNDDDEDDEVDEGNFEVFRGLYFSKEREKKAERKYDREAVKYSLIWMSGDR